LGISGFKLDFGDDYILGPTVKTHIGEIGHQQYSEKYYRDMLAFGLAKLGREEFTTMSRPYDISYETTGRFYAKKEHCPIGWVGDNRRDWIGLIDALDQMFISAQAGYMVLGSDVGGYLDRDDKDLTKLVPFSQTNFARWVAIGALGPFMQLHGRGNFTPWTVPVNADETVNLYRYWATLHHELVPFFYSLAQEGYANGKTILRPVGSAHADWVNDYRYQLGDAFLVAPILDDTGIRDIKIPSGARYIDWWDSTATPIPGGTVLTAYSGAMERSKMPLFIKEGAIVPLDISDERTHIGNASHSGKSTWLIWPAQMESKFVAHDVDDLKTEVTAQKNKLIFSRIKKGAYVKLMTDSPVTQISVNGMPLVSHANKSALDSAQSGFTSVGFRVTWIKLELSERLVTLAW
jgi:alpha-glucosidase (family GH31 glycosyl hydrolase)